MAARMYDLDAEAKDRAARMVDVGLDAINRAVCTLPAKVAVSELNRARSYLSGLETELLSRHVSETGDTRSVQDLLNDGKTSRKQARRKSKRAAADANSGGKLSDKMASGDMSEEQADIVADADAASDGAASKDDGFIDAIAAADPDRGRDIKDNWLAKHKSADGVQSEHDRQRALRRMLSFLSKRNGLATLMLEGDSVTQKLITEVIKARADEIYRRDGGRDLPTGEHPRTRNQREFDAAIELLLGTQLNPTGTTTPTAGNNTDNSGDSSTGNGSGTSNDRDSNGAGGTTNAGDNDRGRGTTSGAGSGDARGSAGVGRTSPRCNGACRARESVRPRIVVALTLDKLIGNDRAAMATQIGLGLIPDSVLADYAEYGDIIGALFDTNGDQLWQGRSKRNATAQQFLALTLRDRGCVLCRADQSRCEAHHIMPWEAPAKGRSDLDKMALLCTACHHKLHANNHTLYRIAPQHWDTRPATAHETPPTPLHHRRKPKHSRTNSGHGDPGKAGPRNQV